MIFAQNCACRCLYFRIYLVLHAQKHPLIPNNVYDFRQVLLNSIEIVHAQQRWRELHRKR